MHPGQISSFFALAIGTLATFPSSSTAYGGHESYGSGEEQDSYGDGGHGGGGGDSHGGGGGGGHGGGGSYGGGVDLAVNSKHSVDTYAVKTSNEPPKTPVVDINSGPLSLKIRFNSHSSNIQALQNHFGSKGQVKKSSSVDQPDILIHSVKKPIIQEIKEIISPYRKRIQEVKPVQEKIETIIATGSGRVGGYGEGGGGYSGKGY